MKILIIIMLILSLFMGIPTNKGWFTLYGTEFFGPFYVLKGGNFPNNLLVIWILLILFHLSIFSLPFIIKKSYFKYVLYYAPLSFIITYFLFAPLAIFFLIPFIIVWVICIVRFNKSYYTAR